MNKKRVGHGGPGEIARGELQAQPLRGKGVHRPRVLVRILISSGFPIRRSDASFLKTLGLQVRRTDNILLDLMVADESTVVIGVPDPTSKEAYHSIAIAVSSQPFAVAVRASLEEVWSNAR